MHFFYIMYCILAKVVLFLIFICLKRLLTLILATMVNLEHGKGTVVLTYFVLMGEVKNGTEKREFNTIALSVLTSYTTELLIHGLQS